MAGLIQERMKRLQESTVSDNVVLHALGNIGLGNHGILFQRFYSRKLNGNRPFAHSAPVSTQNESGFRQRWKISQNHCISSLQSLS